VYKSSQHRIAVVVLAPISEVDTHTDLHDAAMLTSKAVPQRPSASLPTRLRKATGFTTRTAFTLWLIFGGILSTCPSPFFPPPLISS
jgi:hypothetical protein